jgi:NAD+--asparagine ADP-ribosyltransferase
MLKNLNNVIKNSAIYLGIKVIIMTKNVKINLLELKDTDNAQSNKSIMIARSYSDKVCNWCGINTIQRGKMYIKMKTNYPYPLWFHFNCFDEMCEAMHNVKGKWKEHESEIFMENL